MGRVVLACKSDEERKIATCPVFAPFPIHTDRQAESLRHCVGFRSGITGENAKEGSKAVNLKGLPFTSFWRPDILF